MKKPLLLLMSVCFLLGASACADAGPLGRCLGLGWSDGYHAKCGCDQGRGCGWFQGFFCCSDPCWNDPGCVKTKVVSPGCFGCGARIVPVYEPGPVCHP